MRKANVLRKLLNEGKPTLGTHVITPWPGMFEVIGNSGVFNYIEYVAEYSTWTLPLLEDIGRTMELFPDMALMIKIEEQARGLLATRAIDAGFQSVIFTDIRSAEDVKECVRYIRAETPEAGARDTWYQQSAAFRWLWRIEGWFSDGRLGQRNERCRDCYYD